ncbi:MAG: phosphoribosylformylglycinamidine synthase subunit PurS [Phycisphaerales bacterium]|nr:MAG: phosphoribosylformylglycinamidine synthase subunit PurS [Phycisphaerales bacterium]
MNLWWVEVRPRRPQWDAHGAAVLAQMRSLGLHCVERVASARLFVIEGSLAAADVERAAVELLADPVAEEYVYGGADAPRGRADHIAVEVHLKPGVMDPVARSVKLGLADMGLRVDAVRTARRYDIVGLGSLEQLEFAAWRVLANDCIENAYLTGFGRHDDTPLAAPTPPQANQQVRCVSLSDLHENALQRLSREGHLFLSPDEMQTIRSHFRSLGREPTDLELETLAQTWSEHCVHKTLKSRIVYRGDPMPDASNPQHRSSAPVEIEYANLLADTIARATHTLNLDWCLSVFKDNAGVIAFDDEYGIAFKVETHNHPSAIEPYGGAATGVGGCVRDVIGCGLGAKPIANTDVFCLAPSDWPMERLPRNVLHPVAILRGVVAGVRDYGNRMGIPTINGALAFDGRYLGNPLVYVGCLGLIPRGLIRKQAHPGDRILLVGGCTGRDGLHGATFSSAELTETHADEFAHAVQIGDPITEKKMLDCILQARDHADGCLYSAITDCGAGGLSSAVGEMGSEIGARVQLETVPLKYAGLRYDEIWISEAQERMVLAVPPANVEKLLAVFAAEDVEATVIGEFTDDNTLTVAYRGEVVGELKMEFLHHGLPQQTRVAEWFPPDEPQRVPPQPIQPGDVKRVLIKRLTALNTTSKEWVIRQYDHEVQGGSVVTPLVGRGDGPSDAAVLRPRLDSDRGIAVGCGLCPELADVDPYWMAVAAVDEALRNVVCVGGDPSRTAILDNFCWPKCEDPRTLGALVRACQGAHDAAVAYGLPFISGKDSLNNEFAMSAEEAARCGLPQKLAIPPTLLISAVSIIEDVRRCITAAAKPDASESQFYYIGHCGSHWDEVSLADRLKVHRVIHRLIADGVLTAAHDVGSDGIAVALAEMAIGGHCGISVVEPEKDAQCRLFESQAGGYIVQVPHHKSSDLVHACLDEMLFELVGMIAPEWGFHVTLSDGSVESIPPDELEAAWKKGMFK